MVSEKESSLLISSQSRHTTSEAKRIGAQGQAVVAAKGVQGNKGTEKGRGQGCEFVDVQITDVWSS